jgi:hypothetical protein
MIAHNPLHGSGQAGFPHPALALGEDAQASQGIGMTDSRHRQLASGEAPHAIRQNAVFVAAQRKRAMPEPPYWESKDAQRVVVLGHSVISDVSAHHRLQPLAHFGDGFMHASLKFGFHLVPLRLQPFANRLPQYRERPLLLFFTPMCEEVERLRFLISTPLPLIDRKRTELQKSRLLGMQFQIELSHSFRKFRPELIGIRFAVKAHHDVVRESHHDRCTRWGLPLLITASASRSNSLTRLNTRPARSPVNASTLLLRTAPHESGPMWVAVPHSYDFCIHYTSPV